MQSTFTSSEKEGCLLSKQNVSGLNEANSLGKVDNRLMVP